MRSGYPWARKTREIAAFGALALAGASAAWGASSAIVRFTGSLVAPPFQFAVVGPAAMPQASGGSLSASATAAAVTFAPRPGYDFGADVSVMAAGDAGPSVSPYVATRFTDGAGHRLTQGERGHYHVGASGGTLSLAYKKGIRVPEDTHLIVVVAYP